VPIQTFPKQESQKEFDFYISGFSELLVVNSMPQSIPDSAAIVAQNVYGSQEGGLYMRKGIATRGSVLEASSLIKGLFRFEQQTVNGTPQNPSIVKLLAEVGTTNIAGGDLWNVDTNTQIGASNVLGAAAQPWSAQEVYDSDHTLPTASAPTNSAPTGGGSLAAGTYLVSQTWLNGAGETLRSTDISIVIGLNQETTITQSAPPTGAISWNVYASTTNGNRASETAQNVSPIAVGTTTFLFSALIAGTAPPASDTAIAASDVLVICTGSGGPYVYDGSTVYVPAAWTTNCPAARWCQVVNNILFFGGIASQPNLVVGMALGHPETLATAGMNNFTFSHQVQGLAIFGAGATAGLVVGLTQGIAVVYGTGLQNFYEQEVPSYDGVAAGRTMITVDGYVYFLGRDDIYMFDGTAIQPMGQKVRPYILNDPLFDNQWDIPMSGSRPLSWAMYYNRRIYFWYDTGNVGHPNCALVWDMNLHGWTTLVGESLNAACLLDASSDGAPLACVVGGSTTAQCYNFDVYNGTGHNVDDAGTGIAVQVSTKYFKVGQPGTDKRLMRAYIELFLESFAGVILINTDYGAQSTSKVVASATLTGAIWDVSDWDESSWSAGFLQFVNPRTDFEVKFEALSLGVFSNAVMAPFWLQGFSGRAIQETMN
jgi:hypothetical protein